MAALIIDANGEILASNASADRLFGGEAEELVGNNWAGIDAQMTLIQFKKNWKNLMGKGVETYQTDLLTKSGMLRPVNVRLLVRPHHQDAIVNLEDRFSEGIDRQLVQRLSEHVGIGAFTYNWLDNTFWISKRATQLLDITDTEPASILTSVEAKLEKDVRQRLHTIIDRLRETVGEFAETFRYETAAGTHRLRVHGRSWGNELHATHLWGLVERINHGPEPTAKSVATQSSALTDLATFSLEEARDMIFWTRPDGTFFYANQSAARQLGYEQKEFSGLPIAEVAPAFNEDARLAFWDRLRSEKSMSIDYDLYHRDGTLIHTSATINYLRAGDEEYAYSFCRDVTEQVAQRNRRSLLESTIENAREMILWVQPDGIVKFANQTFLRRTGLSREEVEEHTVGDFFPSVTEAERLANWEQLRQKKQLILEVELNLPDGKRVPCRATLNYLVVEGREYDCVYLTDWTEKVRRDNVIRHSQRALDESLDYILWLDDELKITYANNTLLRFAGKKPEQLIGQPVKKLWSGIHAENLASPRLFEIKVKDRNNQDQWLSVSANKISDAGPDGQRNMHFLSCRNVTSEWLAREKLRKAYAENAELKERLQQENLTLREDVKNKYAIENIITVSEKYRKVIRQVSQVANVDTTVLITGETGTGKELLARAVHSLSSREAAAMVKVNCAALPENLIESELFGHEKGAFTGAIGRKKGRFELAHRGTIFLDEIGELPLDLQAKLLRVLQEGEFERLGGTESIKVDVRLIAATNRNLAKMVRKGRFREDLYYRLNVFPIENMPLRERPEDIPLLVEHFAKQFARQQGKNIKKINGADLKKLEKYHFPGNIRELENLVERAVVLCNSDVLSIQIDAPQTDVPTEFLSFEAMQRRHIIQALKKTGGRITGQEGAGRLLGLNDRTLMSKMRKLEIEKREYIE